MHSCVKTDQRKKRMQICIQQKYLHLADSTLALHTVKPMRTVCSSADFMIQSKLHDIQFILQVVQSTLQPIVMTVELQSEAALERSLVAAGILVPFY